MRYQASFGADGVDYMMVGTKHVSKLAGPNVWGHTTTLFITIARNGSWHGLWSSWQPASLPILWQKGVRMLFTLRGTGSDLLDKTQIESRFSFRKIFR